MQADVAKEWRVSKAVVALLMGKVRRNKELLSEIMAKRADREDRRKAIELLVQRLNDEDAFIDSAEAIQAKIKQESDLTVQQHEVRDVMKRDLGMSYRKVRRISDNSNIERSLILR